VNLEDPSKSDASAPVVFDGEYAISQEDIRRTWRRAPYDCHAPGSEVVAYQQQETTVIAHPMSAIKSRLRQTIGSAMDALALLYMALTNAVRDEQ
jgi:hypothetical protein